jgi:hypothetical protein
MEIELTPLEEANIVLTESACEVSSTSLTCPPLLPYWQVAPRPKEEANPTMNWVPAWWRAATDANR